MKNRKEDLRLKKIKTQILGSEYNNIEYRKEDLRLKKIKTSNFLCTLQKSKLQP